MKSSLVGICVLALAACQSPSTAEVERDAPARDCVFLQLKSGPRSAVISKEESQKVFAGHFENMLRLAQAGQLLVAGPYASPKRDADLRGVFILSPADIDEAEALARTDPGVIAGVFRTESVRMRTHAPLDAYLEHQLALLAQDKAEGRERDPGEGGRSYVLLTAEHGRRARQTLLDMRGILLWGELADGRALAIVDAVDIDACVALLEGRGDRMGPFVMDLWYSSGELVKLPEMRRQAAR